MLSCNKTVCSACISPHSWRNMMKSFRSAIVTWLSTFQKLLRLTMEFEGLQVFVAEFASYSRVWRAWFSSRVSHNSVKFGIFVNRCNQEIKYTITAVRPNRTAVALRLHVMYESDVTLSTLKRIFHKRQYCLSDWSKHAANAPTHYKMGKIWQAAVRSTIRIYAELGFVDVAFDAALPLDTSRVACR